VPLEALSCELAWDDRLCASVGVAMTRATHALQLQWIPGTRTRFRVFFNATSIKNFGIRKALSAVAYALATYVDDAEIFFSRFKSSVQTVLAQ
jgi:hypothetical protein